MVMMHAWLTRRRRVQAHIPPNLGGAPVYGRRYFYRSRRGVESIRLSRTLVDAMIVIRRVVVRRPPLARLRPLHPMMRSVLALLAVLTIMFVSSCGDGVMDPEGRPAPPPPPPPPPPPVVAASVSISPQDVSFRALGDSATLMATVRGQNGAVMPNPTVAWTSSNADAVGVRDGVVTALGNGESTITAISGSVSATASVRVAQVATRIIVEPDSVFFVSLGDTLRLEPRAEDANGHAMAVPELTWRSGDEEVVTVADGFLTAIGIGEAEVIATAADLRATVAVSVSQSVDAVEVSAGSLSFSSLGDTVRVTAVARDPNGNEVAAAFTWRSADTTVAVVEDGLVTSVGNGTTAITAAVGEVESMVSVMVAQVATRIMVEPDSVFFVSLGDTLRLEPRAEDANGHAMAVPELTWRSADTTVAVVEDGLVTSVGNGTTAITAAVGEVESTVSVVVEQVMAEFVVEPAKVMFESLGDTARLVATGRDSLGSAVLDVAASWVSTDSAVAAVDSLGLVKAVGTGEAEIVASYEEWTARAMVSVGQEIDTVVVPMDSIDLRFPGDTVRIAAHAYDAVGSLIRGATFTFLSSDTAVVTVGRDGLVRAVAAGEAMVTVSLGDFTKVIPVRVTVDPMGVEILRDRIVFLYLHQYEEIRATIRDGGGQPLEGEVKWSSTNTDIVRVPTRCGGTPGLEYPCARSISEGTAVLLATVVGTETLLVDSIPLRVEIASRIKLAGTNLYAFDQPGAVFQIEAEVLRQDGTPIEYAPIEWSSEEPRVATVDSAGLVEVHDYGSTLITIRAGKVRALVFIDVISPVVSVRVEPDSLTLNAIGDSAYIQLLGKMKFGDGERSLAGRWSSSDTTIVAVRGSVLGTTVTARGEGRAEVIGTHSGADATFADTAYVLVDPVSRITVTPSSLTFTNLGDRAQLQVEAFTRSGARVPNPRVTWMSADVSIATVDSTGMVVARNYGTTSITAQTSNVSETVSVNVSPMFRLERSPVEPKEGDTLTYKIVPNSAPRVSVTLSYSVRSLDGVSDVAHPDGQAVLPAGATSLSLTFPILDDTEIEPPRDTLVMTLRDVVRGGETIDTLVIREGVCDRTGRVKGQIMFWLGYRDPMNSLKPDVSRCPEITSEELLDVSYLRLTTPDVVPLSSDMRARISAEDPLDETTLALEAFEPEPSLAADVSPLNLTKADLGGLDNLIDLWVIGYDLRDVNWDEKIFSDLPVIEQIFLLGNRYRDLPSTMFEGINTREGECPPRTLYGRRCKLVSLRLGRSRIEGAVSPDLLDPLTHLRALQLHSLPDITSLPEGFLDDVRTLGNLTIEGMPLTSLDADLLANNQQLFNLVMNALFLDIGTALPPGLLANQESLLALSLANNGLTDISDAFPERMPELARLYLQSNALMSLPSDFLSRFPALEQLDLSSNQLSSLPDGFFAGLTKEFRFLDLSGNPGPDGDPATEDFTLDAAIVRTDTSALAAPGPATIVVDVPVGTPSDTEFDLFLFGGSAGGSPVTETNQTAFGTVLLRAGSTRSEALQVTMVDTVPYFNVVEPSDEPNTSAEVTISLGGGALEIAGLRLEADDIEPIRLFESSTDAISIPRLLQPLPQIRLLRGNTNYFGRMIGFNPDLQGRATIDLADYVAPRDGSTQTISVYPDLNFEFPFGVKQTFVYDTTSTSPLVVDTLAHPTQFVLDPTECPVNPALCFHSPNTPYAVTIDVVDDSTFVTLRTALEVEVVEVDTTKLNIEWVDVNGNLPTVVSAAIDSAVDRWGEILADVRDVRVPPEVAPHLGCFGVAPPKHYMGIDDLLIWVTGRSLDGPGGTLAGAAQCFLREASGVRRRNGLHQPAVGFVLLDLDDIPRLVERNLLVPTITHEIGHILGIGMGEEVEGSWYQQGVCANDPNRCFNGRLAGPYVPGPGAIAAFDSAGGRSVEGHDIFFGRKVPIEPGFSSGSSGNHWSEFWLDNELMTAIVDRESNPLSRITARIFEDMGLALRPGWENAVDDYCILTINAAGRGTHPCAPSTDRPVEDIALSADEKVARGLGFDLRGDVLTGPLWVIGSDGQLRRIR